MGFLGFLKREKAKPRPEAQLPPIDIGLPGLPAWLKSEISDNTGSARKKSMELQDRIVRAFSQVKSSADRLARAEFESKDKTYAAVNSVKNTFANRTQSLASKCPEPSPDSYSGMQDFQNRAGELLKELMKVSPRQGVIVSNYFRKESGSIMGGVKALNSLLEEFQRFLDFEGKSLFILEEAERISSEISKKLEDLKALEKREGEIRQEIQGLSQGLSKRKSGLNMISRDSRWRDLEKARGESQGLEREAGELKFRIGEEFSSAKRPLKKYLHLKSQELSREDRDFLERFVKSPLKAVSGRGPGQLLPALQVLRGMVGREISLKDKEKAKLDELIKRLESGEISGLMDRYEKIIRDAEERSTETEREFSGLNQEREQAEAGIKEAGDEIKALERELQDAGKMAKSLKQEIQGDRERLEKLIYENINRKVNILLNNGAIG
jgi:hypothetical protein